MILLYTNFMISYQFLFAFPHMTTYEDTILSDN
jgi:hypothetical protein